MEGCFDNNQHDQIFTINMKTPGAGLDFSAVEPMDEGVLLTYPSDIRNIAKLVVELALKFPKLRQPQLVTDPPIELKHSSEEIVTMTSEIS